jgi:iron complex outermembrane recepter protein
VSTSFKSDLRFLACPLLGLLALAARPAAADSGTDTGALGEVVVTATKLNAADVLSVPASIQAISGSTLAQEDASGITSIAGQIPGFSMQDLGPGDKRYVIRGIYSAGDSTVGVYYGEAVITQGNSDDGAGFQPDIRMYDMNRIEVLRGPQGTLYGANSESGTIRYIPNEPELDKTDGSVTAEASETQHASGNYNGHGVLNLPIVNGVLGLRVVAWKDYDSGYINQIRVGTGVTGVSNGVTMPVQALGFLKGVNDDDVGGGRAILRYQPVENLTIDADYTAQSETSDGSSRWTPPGVTAFNGGAIAPVQGCDLCNTDVTQSPWDDHLQVYGVTVNWHTDIGVLTATDHQFDRNTDFTFDSTPILISFGIDTPAETLEPRQYRANSSEMRFASSFDFPVNFVVGVFRQQSTQTLDVNVITTNGLGLVDGPFSTSNSQDALNYPGVGDTFFGRIDHRGTVQSAGFGEATWKITKKWTAVAGIRYFTEDLTGYQEQTHPFGGFPPGAATLVPIPDVRQSYNKATWKGNISYEFSGAALAYATVATGFRSGGLNAQSEPFEPIPGAYSPDSLTNYELGLKGRLFSGYFAYQIDGYLIHWNNMQVQLTTPDGTFSYIGNAGTADVKGGEFDLKARPFQYLTAWLAGSYQNAYLTQGASAAQKLLNPTLGVTGDTVPNVPDFQFAAGLDYSHPLTGDWLGSLGTDVTYRGAMNSYFASNPFNLPLPSYTLWNLRAGATYQDWTVTLFARNVTNERAEVSAINSTQDPHGLLTVQPRTIGVTVTRDF